MPAWVVIYRRHHRKAAPYRHVTKNTSPQLLLFLTLTNCDACNPFRIRSYENCRVTSFKPNIFHFPRPAADAPIFRIFFQVPYPAPPLLCQSYATFASRTVLRDENCRGVYQQFPFWFASKPAVGNSSLATSHSPPYSSSLFSHSCALFCAFLHTRKTQPFSFQEIPHSLAKTTGVGGGTFVD